MGKAKKPPRIPVRTLPVFWTRIPRRKTIEKVRLVGISDRDEAYVLDQKGRPLIVRGKTLFASEKLAVKAFQKGVEKWLAVVPWQGPPRVEKVMCYISETTGLFRDKDGFYTYGTTNGKVERKHFYGKHGVFETEKEALGFISGDLEECLESTKRRIAHSLVELRDERRSVREVEALQKRCRAKRIPTTSKKK